jgi:hypothetical protein
VPIPSVDVTGDALLQVDRGRRGDSVVPSAIDPRFHPLTGTCRPIVVGSGIMLDVTSAGSPARASRE